MLKKNQHLGLRFFCKIVLPIRQMMGIILPRFLIASTSNRPAGADEKPSNTEIGGQWWENYYYNSIPWGKSQCRLMTRN
jgi:hypothetical protein